MNEPPNKRGPRYLYNERLDNVHSLRAEKAKIEEKIKKLEKDDLFLEEQFFLTLLQLQEKIDKLPDS